MGQVQRYKELQLGQLRSFCLVATEGSFTAAAKLLGVSVPSVWEQVRALERKLKASLVHQQGRSLELTPEGRVLVELVHPHVVALDSLERLFEMRRGEAHQELTIASTHYLLSYHLPRPLQEFTGTHPAVRLNLRATLAPEVSQLVGRAQADVGVVPHMRDEPVSAEVTCEHLFDLHFTLLTTARHPLARKKHLTPHDLVQYPIIMAPPESHADRTLQRILRQHRLSDRLRAVAQSQSVDMSRQYAALGIGIALAYLGREANLRLPGLHLRPFDPAMAGLPVVMVVRKYAHVPEPVAAFQHLLRQFLATDLASRKA